MKGLSYPWAHLVVLTLVSVLTPCCDPQSTRDDREEAPVRTVKSCDCDSLRTPCELAAGDGKVITLYCHQAPSSACTCSGAVDAYAAVAEWVRADSRIDDTEPLQQALASGTVAVSYEATSHRAVYDVTVACKWISERVGFAVHTTSHHSECVWAATYNPYAAVVGDLRRGRGWEFSTLPELSADVAAQAAEAAESAARRRFDSGEDFDFSEDPE